MAGLLGGLDMKGGVQPFKISPAPQQAAPAPANPMASSRMLTGIGMMGGLMGMNGLTNAAKMGLDYNPQVAEQMSRAKAMGQDPASIDYQSMVNAANSGNAALAHLFYNKLMYDSNVRHFANWNGTNTTTDPMTGQTTYYTNPNKGTMYTQQGGLQLMPGAARTQAQSEAATRAGQEAATLHKVVNSQGATFEAPGAQLYPFYRQLLGNELPASGGQTQTSSQPNSQTPAQTNPGIAPQPTQDTGPNGSVMTGLPSEQQTYLQHRGEQNATYMQDLQHQSDSAQQMNYQLDQMRQALSGFQTGRFTDAFMGAKNAIAGLGQLVGVQPPQDISNYQEFTKYANQVAFAQTRLMGSREAAQIVHMQIASNPNAKLTPNAVHSLLDSMQAMNDYILKKNEYLQTMAQHNNGDTTVAASQWSNRVDPRAWDMAINKSAAQKTFPQIGAQKLYTTLQVMDPTRQASILNNLTTPQAKQVIDRIKANDPAMLVPLYHAWQQQQGNPNG